VSEVSWLERAAESIPYANEWLDRAGLSAEAATAVVASLLVIGVLLMWIFMQRGTIRTLRAGYDRAGKVLRAVNPERGLENNLESFLELYEAIVEAPVYAFYILDPKKENYILKAVRHNASDFGKVRPSYSGLADYKKEDYHPPLSLPAAGQAGVHAVTEGEVPMIAAVLDGGRGLVRIGPYRDKLKKRVRSELAELGGMIGSGLGTLVDMETITDKADVVVASGRAMQQINRIALHSGHTMELMTRLSVQSIGAAGGLYMERQGDGYYPAVRVGLDDRLVDSLFEDGGGLDWFTQWLPDDKYHLVKRHEPLFRQLPGYLTEGAEAIAAVRVGIEGDSFMLFWFSKLGDDEEEQAALSTIRLIQNDIGTITSLQRSLARFSGTYSGILKGLAQLLDNMSPYTVGYSELMSRYAIMIAKELGLSDQEISDVALAAYLSNIGMLGITIDLYQKEGKYTEQEFELMKLHAEIGASIVRTTIGNERVAEYILYHHERMDGNGYPAGLKAADIPIGSRIIAVVQTFLAKINGRKYRDPLPFHQALQTLRAAAGSQLDSRVVEAFIGWYERKQTNPQFNGRSLGSCWEMGCVPSSICRTCPVYQRPEVNCWEVGDNNCRSHGKTCETCFVKTEFVNRTTTRKRA